MADGRARGRATAARRRSRRPGPACSERGLVRGRSQANRWGWGVRRRAPTSKKSKRVRSASSSEIGSQAAASTPAGTWAMLSATYKCAIWQQKIPHRDGNWQEHVVRVVTCLMMCPDSSHSAPNWNSSVVISHSAWPLDDVALWCQTCHTPSSSVAAWWYMGELALMGNGSRQLEDEGGAGQCTKRDADGSLQEEGVLLEATSGQCC